MSQNRKIVGICAILAVSVGAANSIFKNKRLPSSRFLIGSGVAFLLLSALSETETGSELAKGLAMGIATTVILGDGGGLLSYVDGRGETDTQRATAKKVSKFPSLASTPPRVTVPNPNGQFRSDTVPPQPGQHPTTH